MSAAPNLPEPLWARALDVRARRLVDLASRCARWRLDLVQQLARAGVYVSLVEVHAWSNAQQGEAYLWAWAVEFRRVEPKAEAPHA